MTIADTKEIKEATRYLQDNKLVAFPTETVYGLGGNALSDAAVASIYETKNRPDFNPLIVHVASAEIAKEYVTFTPLAERLAQEFWPGPMTLVLERKAECALSLLVSAGLDTVAIRVPTHPLAQALLSECGLPLAAPSANKSGRISPTLAAHVQEELGNDIAMILDGGACEEGIESTVIDARTEQAIILRPGSITSADLIPYGGIVADKDSKYSPGQLTSHYAPQKIVRLGATDIQNGEGLLAFGAALPGANITENLSPKADLKEAAANVFAMLRTLDASNAKAIAVMPIPEIGLGVAINDRLRRAAAPKD